MKNRLHYLDSFRGLTIFAMILSGNIAFNNCLPAWMYHAQVPPPLHQFNGNIAGLTWVDLVFPFFLFSMGVSIPIAMQKQLATNSTISIVGHLFKRMLLLMCFSLIIQQLKTISGKQANFETAIYFLFIFYWCNLIYIDWKKLFNWPFGKWWNILLAILCICFLVFVPKNIDLKINQLKIESDIIIMVLANVSFSAGLFFIYFRKSVLKFWIGYAVIFALLCFGKLTTGSFNSWFNFTPFPNFFRWEFHKYLLIVLPGVFVGQLFLNNKLSNNDNKPNFSFSISVFVFIGLVLACLFLQQLGMLWILSVYFFYLFYKLCLIDAKNKNLNFYLLIIAAVFYFLGLILSPTQGGIKKDHSTFSYLILTPGLATLCLLAFKNLTLFTSDPNKNLAKILIRVKLNFLQGIGANALGAYEMGKFLVWPLLIITHSKVFYDDATNNVWACFFRGFVFTCLACSFAYISNKLKLGWKA